VLDSLLVVVEVAACYSEVTEDTVLLGFYADLGVAVDQEVVIVGY
jgi:hypothetical protein